MLFLPVLISSIFWGQTAPSWQALSHPAGEHAMAVYLDVTDGDLVMSWINRQDQHRGQFKYARYHQGQWQKTTTLIASDKLFINWADIPKVLLSKDLSLAVWPEMMGSGTYEYGLRYRASTDFGKTWSTPAWLHDDRTPGEHGFVSLTSINEDRIGALWLDGRDMAQSGHEHEGHNSGSMQLRYREISPAGLHPEIMLDDMTCECCGTDLLLFQGQPTAIYRDRSTTHIRDIRLAMGFKNKSWQINLPLLEDQWEIHGCPVNGPALAQNGQTLAAVWFTMAKQTPKIRLAISQDPQKDWKDLGTLGQNPMGRVDIAFLDQHQFIIVWLENDGDHEAIYYAVMRLDDLSTPRLRPTMLDKTSSGRNSGFPKLAVGKDTCYIAYQATGKPGIKLQKLTLPLP